MDSLRTADVVSTGVDEASVDEASVDEASVDEASVDERERTIYTRVLGGLSVGLAALAMGLLVWFGLTQLPAEMGTMPYVGVWLQLILMAYVGAMIWCFTRPLSPRARTNSVLLLLGIFFLAILTVKLKNTEFTVGGINGDARFYTTYITKLANYPGYGDMFYKELPAFYPPLYYFVVGRVADWLSMEPFRLMKPALLVTVMLLPLITGALWRRLVDERLAAAVALCMLVFPDWFKPNEWLALACFVPWWLHWVDNITGYCPTPRRKQIWWWLGGGLIGALLFQLYFFWFFVGGVTLLVRMGWWLLVRRDDRQLRASLVNAVLMLGVTALLSSPFWAPYLYSMVETGGWRPLQNRWFADSKVPLPLDFLRNEWQAVVYMGGLAYLVLGAASDRVARGILWLVIGFFVWVAIGYVGILAHTPLLTFRSYPVLTYLLGAGAFLGLFRLWHGDFAWRERIVDLLPWQRMATLLFILVVLLFANDVITELQSQENVQDAVAATYPVDELAAFDRLTAGDYEERVILVTDSYRSILFFRPIYSFLAWSAHFSHPAGRFHDRVDFLTKLAQLHDPEIFAAAIALNRYDPIDYWLLRPTGRFWHYQFVDDNFPDRVVDRAIYFPGHLFTNPFFTEHTEATYTLFRTAAELPPLLDATGDVSTSTLVEVAQLYTMLTLFREHLPYDHLPYGIEMSEGAAQARLLTEDVTALPIATLLDLRRAATGPLATKVGVALTEQLALPEPVVFADNMGTARLQLLGYQVYPATEATNSAGTNEVTLDLYFETLAPMTDAYTVWLHLFAMSEGEHGEMDGEKLIFDHTPPLATDAWVPGHIYRDRTTLTVEPGRYQIDVGLWEPDLDQRLWVAGAPGVTIDVQIPGN